MANRVVKRLGDAKGTALLEAAIITPLFLLLTFSIVDFGGMFYAYLALENGVSLASRYGVTGQSMDDPSNPGTPLNHQETLKAAKPDRPAKPVQDEWGFFDPQQCGFAALLAKLDEVTDSDDGR